MSYITIDSYSLPQKPPRDQLARNASSVNSHPKPHPPLLQYSTNKTISNYFFKAEKLPLAVEDRPFYKNTSSKPFFTKNRKLLESKNKMSKGPGCPVVVPTGFKNILRAKSTVIKQKKLQEFYINREGRADEMQRMRQGQFCMENTKSNLFRTNFTHKKAKRRINSVSLEKHAQEGNCHNEIQIIEKKFITIQSLTQDLAEAALKEKELYSNQGDKRQETTSGQNPSVKPSWRSLQKRHKPMLDKENIEFVIAPWGGADNDDVCF